MKNTDELLKNEQNVQEGTIEEFECIPLTGNAEPFMLRGTKGNYTLCLGNTAVWPEKIESEEEAYVLLETKPWSLILIASAVYSRFIDELEKKNEK